MELNSLLNFEGKEGLVKNLLYSEIVRSYINLASDKSDVKLCFALFFNAALTGVGCVQVSLFLRIF